MESVLSLVTTVTNFLSLVTQTWPGVLMPRKVTTRASLLQHLYQLPALADLAQTAWYPYLHLSHWHSGCYSATHNHTASYKAPLAL